MFIDWRGARGLSFTSDETPVVPVVTAFPAFDAQYERKLVERLFRVGGMPRIYEYVKWWQIVPVATTASLTFSLRALLRSFCC